MSDQIYPEPILYQQIQDLGMSQEFCLITELSGFHTLADLLKYKTDHLLKFQGFTLHLVHEYVTFMENRGLGKYIDPD